MSTSSRIQYLQAKQRRMKSYGEAIKEDFKDGEFKVSDKPKEEDTRSLDEQAQDQGYQYKLFQDSMKTVMRADEVAKLVARLDPNEILLVNRNFTDIKNELKGRTIDANFFVNFLNRYVQRLRTTGNTGILTPVSAELLEEKLDELSTVIETQIGMKLKNQIDALKPSLDRIIRENNEAGRIVVDRLTEAIRINDGRTAQRILELVQEMSATSRFSDEEIMRLLRSIQESTEQLEPRVVGTAETIPLEALERMDIGAIAGINLRDQSTTTLRNIMKVINIPNRSRYTTKQAMVGIITQTLDEAGMAGEDPTQRPAPRDPSDALPRVDAPADGNIGDDDDYFRIAVTPRERLSLYIESNQELLRFLRNVYPASANSWKGATKGSLSYAVYKFLENKFSPRLDPDGGKLADYLIDTAFPLETYTYYNQQGNADITINYLNDDPGIAERVDDAIADYNASVTNVQTAFRGFLGRRELRRLREARQQEEQVRQFQANRGARNIQRGFRDMMGRRQDVANAQKLADLQAEVADMTARVNALPDQVNPIAPVGLTAGQLRQLVQDYYDLTTQHPFPRMGQDEALRQQRDIALQTAFTRKQAFEDAMNRIRAAAAGGPPADVGALTAEGEALRDRRVEVNQQLLYIRTLIQHRGNLDANAPNLSYLAFRQAIDDIPARAGERPLFSVQDVRRMQDIYRPLAGLTPGARARQLIAMQAPLNQETTDIELRLDAINRELNRVGEPRIAGTGARFKRVVVGRGLPEPKKEPLYITFGKYVLHLGSLKNNELSVRYKCLAEMTSKFPRAKISDTMTSLLTELVNTQSVNMRLYNKLSNKEHKLLHRLFDLCEIGKVVEVPKEEPDDDDDDDVKRYELLRGLIVSGNNSPKELGEFKQLLLKMRNEGKIDKTQANKVLEQMLML